MYTQQSNILQIKGLSPIRRVVSENKLQYNRSPSYFQQNRDYAGVRKNRCPRWKQLIHPEIQAKFNNIIANLSEVRGQDDCFEDAKSMLWQKSLLDKLHIDTDQKLTEIQQNQKKLYNNQTNIHKQSKQKTHSMKQQQSTFEDYKSFYEGKISILEHQNRNLKQQLFYLREAVIKLYETSKK